MTNRILISSNTISYIINNFLISTNREKLLYVANIRVAGWKRHFQCSIFQVCLLPILVLSPLCEVGPNRDDKR